jgi:uncharacterized delta-60 repeat protein
MKKLLLAACLFFVMIAHGQVNTSLLDTSYNHSGFWRYADTTFQHLYCSDADSAGNFIGVFTQPGLAYNRIFKYTESGVKDTLFENNDTLFLSPQYLSQYLDTVFNGHAIVDIKFQPDHKIVVLSSAYHFIAKKYKMVVTRLNQNGSIDSAFAINGSYAVNYDNYTIALAQKLQFQTDNKILVLGLIGVPTNNNYATIGSVVARLNIDGSIDSTFNGIGYNIINGALSTSVFQNSNGNILLPYEQQVSDYYFFRVIRLTAQGDSVYCSPYIFQTYNNNTGIGVGLSDIKMDINDNMYVSGNCYSAPNTNDTLVIFKIKNNYTLDNGFANSGKAIFTNQYNYARHFIDCSNDGNLYSASAAYIVHHDSTGYSLESYIQVVNYFDNGVLNNAFGYNGVYYLSIDRPVGYNTDPIPYYLPGMNKLLIRGAANVVKPSGVGSETFFVARINIDTVSLILGLIDNPTITQQILAYPNPIQNSTINLSYELTNKQDISIDLYDIKGQLITSLLTKQPRQKGSNIEVLNLPSGLAVGQYILRVVVGEYQKGIQIMVE